MELLSARNDDDEDDDVKNKENVCASDKMIEMAEMDLS